MFKIGQKVVCLDSGEPTEECLNSPKPIVGKIYTVNWIGIGDEAGFIGLEEMLQDDCFWYTNFRPLDESFAEEVLENIKQQIEEEELVLI